MRILLWKNNSFFIKIFLCMKIIEFFLTHPVLNVAAKFIKKNQMLLDKNFWNKAYNFWLFIRFFKKFWTTGFAFKTACIELVLLVNLAKFWPKYKNFKKFCGNTNCTGIYFLFNCFNVFFLICVLFLYSNNKHFFLSNYNLSHLFGKKNSF